MKIHCLGTAGYHPNDTRQTSCYYLPEAGIALDAGTGTYRLPKVLAGKSLNILLSHAHLDHTAGLTFLLDVLANHPLEQIQIWGESDKLAAVREHLFHPLIFPRPTRCLLESHRRRCRICDWRDQGFVASPGPSRRFSGLPLGVAQWKTACVLDRHHRRQQPRVRCMESPCGSVDA